MASSGPMKVIGISYQAVGARDVTLLSTPGVRVKLFDGAQLTGIIYNDKNDPEERCLSGLNVNGILYQEEGRPQESILNAQKIAGIIYQEGRAVSHNISSGSKIIGVTYRETDESPVKLLSGLQLNADILNGSLITGIVHLKNSSAIVKSLRDAALTGVLYRERDADKEDIVTGVRIIGIIYRAVAAARQETLFRKGAGANEKHEWNGTGANDKNGFRQAERVLLYLLPIVGVLGLIVPLVLQQSNLTLLSSYLAVPLIVVPIAYLLYLRFHKRKRGTQSLNKGA